MDHPNCVTLHESFCEASLFYMVMERCRASLLDGLDQMHLASEEFLSQLFGDMLLAIAHVHSLNLIHRDIKPNNWLWGGEDGQTVKLTDFGMARVMPQKGYLTSHCGTAPYMSPEVAGRKRYGLNSDVWSMGVTAYVLLYGGFPFMPERSSTQAMKERILIGEPAPSFAPTAKDAPIPSECARRFVATLMERSQEKRCSAADALRLEFVRRESFAATDLTPSLRSAKIHASAFPKSPSRRPDPTFARNLDEILFALQKDASLCFSEPRLGDVDASCGRFPDELRRSVSSQAFISHALQHRPSMKSASTVAYGESLTSSSASSDDSFDDNTRVREAHDGNKSSHVEYQPEIQRHVVISSADISLIIASGTS